MGYVSNGTEGMMFEEQFCMRCVHMGMGTIDERGYIEDYCPVWSLHQFWNRDQDKDPVKKAALDHFIVPDDSGESDIGQKCVMFIVDTKQTP